MAGDGENQQVIAEQAAKIARLEREIVGLEPWQIVREAISAAGIRSQIGLPRSESGLLRLVVESAANVINAVAGAIFLVDATQKELIFEVATGPQAASTTGVRVPLGHGIAGLVAVTGQPMAVSDVQGDSRHAADVADQIGYEPQSILCVPLLRDGEVVGVLELLDKREQAAFSAGDIQVLGHFAELASVAIDQSRMVSRLSALIQEALFTSLGSSGDSIAADSVAAEIEADERYQCSLKLANTIQRISQHGTPELDAALVLLNGFAEYLESTSGQ